MIEVRRALLWAVGVALLGLSQSPLHAQWTSGSGGISYTGGNVGIGTNSPTAPLDVRSGSIMANFSGTSANNQWLQYGNSVTHANLGVGAIGATAGVPYAWSASDKFMIGSDGRPTLFINGMAGGNVGINTVAPQYPLSVNGTIQAKEVIVNTGWSDYVFAPTYKLRSLESTAAYVKEHHHLPDMPSEAEVKEKGVSVGDVESKLLAKVEELTLQMIQLNEANKQLAARLAQVEHRKVAGAYETISHQ